MYHEIHRSASSGSTSSAKNRQVTEIVMETRIDEIADGIYRLSTYVPQIASPAGLNFNQFLVLGDEPLLFHTGCATCFRWCARPSVG
jgi:hypothetical protein